jgi:serine O-acetyltransferase
MTTSPLAIEQTIPVAQREARRDAVWMGELVEESVPQLLRSHQRAGGLNNRAAHNMPSKGAVGQTCEDLLQILFPGFHDRAAVQDGSVDELTASCLASVISHLTD